MLKVCKDCKVIPGDSVAQHKVMVVNMKWKTSKRENYTSQEGSKIRQWTLKMNKLKKNIRSCGIDKNMICDSEDGGERYE